MPQKVLIIDDSKPIHSLVAAHLRREPVQLFNAFNGEMGLSQAAALQPDLILLDVDMPQCDGFEVCRRLKADPATMIIPVIFLSSAGSTADKIKGLNIGAVDYITKPFDPAELRARVRASLRTKYLMELLAKRAMIDGLTGLWNRTYLEERMVSELSLARRHRGALSCILLDIDHFKSINDERGHTYGDEILRTVAQVLQEECRTEDVLCRYGGEEFAILTPSIDIDGATLLAERLRQKIPARFATDKAPAITCSFGVADANVLADSSLLHAADAALLRAKHSGRNCVATAAPIALKPAV